VRRVTSQRSTDFTTPSRDQIVTISRKHVELMEGSDADDAWIWAGMNHVLLRTVGRRSGSEHKVALPFWRNPEGVRVVVASFAGAPKDPAWFTNLADTRANPRVFVRVQGGAYWSRPEILTGADYTTTWDFLVADRPHYADYRAQTDRTIPLVRLPETEPVEQSTDRPADRS
jgi:deazaflavin-dependent oxidoreductase (nitroreductase family)